MNTERRWEITRRVAVFGLLGFILITSFYMYCAFKSAITQYAPIMEEMKRKVL